MTTTGENIIIFDGFFILLLGLFGTGDGSLGIQLITAIPPPPILKTPNLSCNPYDLVCIGTTLLSPVSTAYVGWAILNFLNFASYIIQVVVTFANVVLRTTFDPNFSPNGVPILGFFFVIMQMLAVYELVRVVRGIGGLVGSTL